jgi:hypothetical protein
MKAPYHLRPWGLALGEYSSHSILTKSRAPRLTDGFFVAPPPQSEWTHGPKAHHTTRVLRPNGSMRVDLMAHVGSL